MNFNREIISPVEGKFNFPFILCIPDILSENSRLIVDIPTPHADSGKLEDMIERNINQRPSFVARRIMENFSYPIMIPIIPRLRNFSTSYLTSQVYHNDFSLIDGDVDDSDLPKFMSIDKQVYEMIKHANGLLNIQNKAIINGYSASSKFATSFSALHPDVIGINISGGTGGLTTLPIKSLKGINLPFPLGVSDIDFDEEEFRTIKHFFYIGDIDNNNPASPLGEISDKKDVCGNILIKLDEDGNPLYTRDTDGLLLPLYENLYTKEEINIIDKLFGHNNQDRFKYIEELYNELGIDSVHKIYKGDHKSIFPNNHETLEKDIFDFVASKEKVRK